MNGNKPKYNRSSKDTEKSTFARKTAAAEILTNLEQEKTYLTVSIVGILIVVILSKISTVFSVIIGVAGAIILALRLRKVKETIEYLKTKYNLN